MSDAGWAGTSSCWPQYWPPSDARSARNMPSRTWSTCSAGNFPRLEACGRLSASSLRSSPGDNLLWRLAGWIAARAFVELSGDLRLDLFEHLSGHAPSYFADRFPGALGGPHQHGGERRTDDRKFARLDDDPAGRSRRQQHRGAWPRQLAFDGDAGGRFHRAGSGRTAFRGARPPLARSLCGACRRRLRRPDGHYRQYRPGTGLRRGAARAAAAGRDHRQRDVGAIGEPQVARAAAPVPCRFGVHRHRRRPDLVDRVVAGPSHHHRRRRAGDDAGVYRASRLARFRDGDGRPAAAIRETGRGRPGAWPAARNAGRAECAAADQPRRLDLVS